jgi:hypothetical protein
MFPIETTILRPRPWPAFLIAIIGIGLLFMPQKNGDQIPFYMGIGIVVLAVVMGLLLSKAGIIIDDSGLTYKTVFVTKEILWDSITKTFLKYRSHGKSGSYYWYFENTQGRTVKFSTGLYSRKSLRTIAEAITARCKTADIEKRIYNMAEGEFPWYIW